MLTSNACHFLAISYTMVRLITFYHVTVDRWRRSVNGVQHDAKWTVDMGYTCCGQSALRPTWEPAHYHVLGPCTHLLHAANQG